MKRLVQKVLLPYVTKEKEELGLPASQKALLILDVYRAHRTEDVLDELKASGFILEYVPANCTGELQPLDVSLNQPYKASNKDAFTDWYADKVAQAIKEHGDDISAAVASVQPDLRLSVIKPLHARWTIDTHTAMALRDDLISVGWEKSGLLAAVGGSRKDDTPPAPTPEDKSVITTKSPSQESTSAAKITESWNGGLFLEHYLPSRLSQSKLDGRTTGSSACTVIAVEVAKRVLDARIVISAGKKQLSQDFVDSFVGAIREGNKLYDTHPNCHGYLSCYQVLQLWPDTKLSVVKEDRFISKAHCKDNLKRIFDETVADGLVVGVLTKSPYSVCVTLCGSVVVIFDSHCHHLLYHGICGALVSVSAECADSDDTATYVSGFFDRCLSSPFKEADFTRLQFQME